MVRRTLLTVAAGAAIVVGAPVYAQAHGGAGGLNGPAGGSSSVASLHSQGPANASSTGIDHASSMSVLRRGTATTSGPATSSGANYSANSQGAVHSQALQHASPTAIAHANSNSVLARGAVSSSTLSGLNTGLTVETSSGTTLGTVSQIITGPNDTVRAVVVTSATGQTYTLPANSLSVSGGIVTTTSTTVSG